MTLENRIEPWEESPSWNPYNLPKSLKSETKGTLVRYEGLTLRARGEYSDELARSLISSHRHMLFEGYA